MTEEERKLLLDIFENTESPEKVNIILDPISRNVTIVYEDCDDEWFRELQSAQQSVQADEAMRFCNECGAPYSKGKFIEHLNAEHPLRR